MHVLVAVIKSRRN